MTWIKEPINTNTVCFLVCECFTDCSTNAGIGCPSEMYTSSNHFCKNTGIGYTPTAIKVVK